MVKVGLEIHQQLDTRKLFCSCPSELDDSYDMEFVRILKPVVSELGEIDRAALEEAKRIRRVIYRANTRNTCAVEWDEEPPHEMNREALRIALQIAKLLKAKVVDEIHVMRKILIDGSAVTGFQRTALIATDGEVDGIRIQTICLEEDSARPVESRNGVRVFNLDRLGIPLVEIATAPEIKSGEEAKRIARRIGELLRMTKVKRGIGTIRQDLNVSVEGGARVEIKGVQELDLIPKIVEYEEKRQRKLIKLRKRFACEKGEIVDVSEIFRQSKSRIFGGKKVFAGVLRGAAGLFAEELHEGKWVGKEIVEYVRAYGFGGFVHSDEDLSKYKLKEELEEVKKKLGAGSKDLIVLAAGSRRIVELVYERVEQFARGVPEDTRKANPDGSTSYMRPLPTGARMYPETDIPPVRPFEVETPELPEERLRRLKKILPEEVAKKLYLSEDFYLFEELGEKPIVGIIITEYLPALRRMGIEVGKNEIRKVVQLYEAGKVTRDAIFDSLIKVARGEKLELSKLSEREVRKLVKKMIAERMEYVKSSPNPIKGLMGVIMGKIKGRYPASEVAKILEEEIKKMRK